MESHLGTQIRPRTSSVGPGKLIASIAGAVLVILGLCYGYQRQTTHSTAKLTDRDKIILADFANKTDDPVFSDTLRQGLTVQLDQSPFYEMVDVKVSLYGGSYHDVDSNEMVFNIGLETSSQREIVFTSTTTQEGRRPLR